MACGCAARAPLAPEPEGRHRVAARDQRLRERRDLDPSDGVGPPCRRPLGPVPKYRPECPAAAPPDLPPPAARPTAQPTARPALPDRGDDPFKDCKCEVKGSCKKVRFPEEVLPEDVASSCSRRHVAPPPPPQCDGPALPPADPPPPPAQRDRAPPPHAPCDCPCWAAYSPDPPASLATGDIYRTCRLPKRFQYPAWFSGYNTGPKHPLYRTTSSDIGRYPPTVHTVTTIYRPADRTTSKIYVPAGPWRNRSLCNTGTIWDVYNYYNCY